MANLICFPHYTCGGLLSDILNNQFSIVTEQGAIVNPKSNKGKIGDTDTIHDQPDVEKIMSAIESMMHLDVWIETHACPSALPLHKFDKVIAITTSTSRSKLYRWSRVYHHYFLPQWQQLSGMQLIDKARETAKNYIVPFLPVQAPDLVNIEFSDFVEFTAEAQQVIGNADYQNSMERWRKINKFLYVENFWNTFECQVFYQAEHEHYMQRCYRYQ
jgi:hypothetical protein